MVQLQQLNQSGGSQRSSGGIRRSGNTQGLRPLNSSGHSGQDDLQQVNIKEVKLRPKNRNFSGLISGDSTMMNSSKSEASMSATSGSNDLSRMAKELTNEMATVVGGFQNEARAAQIIELTSALEDAMKKKRRTEEDAANQIKRLEAHLKLKIEDKEDADDQVVRLLAEQDRLENIINQMKNDIGNVQPTDSPLVNKLADQVENTQKKIYQMRSEVEKKDKMILDLLERLKKPPKAIQEVVKLRKQVVTMEGTMAVEKAKPAKEVLAGRVQQDLSEDLRIIGYKEFPEEIAEGTRKPWMRLIYGPEIQKTNTFCFTISLEKRLKKQTDIKFAIQIFGQKQHQAIYNWNGIGAKDRVSDQYCIDIADYPPGRYRVNLCLANEHTSDYIVVHDRENWEIPGQVVIRKPCSFEWVERRIEIKQSKRYLKLGVVRTNTDEKFTFSYKAESMNSKQNYYNQYGYTSFAEGVSHTDVRIGLNTTPQKEARTEFEVVLLDGKDEDCGCATGNQNKVIVTVINDLEWQYVRFTEIDHLAFNYSDRCALFEVTRSHADGPLDVPWEATRVDNQRIWQEGIWQRMSGHVKFLDGKYTAYIQFDFPAKTKVTGNIEEAEIRLYNPRSNDSCVKIDAERHIRTFSIRYVESEIMDRGSMSLQRGAKWMGSMSGTTSLSSFYTEKNRGQRRTESRRSRKSSSSSGSDVANRSYKNVQTLSGVIRHEAKIISVNHAEVTWPKISSDFIQGFVIIWWPRYKMSENYSKYVDNKTFTCIIELFEENTEYEILVVPETASRPIVQSSVNNRFQETFIQKIIGPSLLNNSSASSLSKLNNSSSSYRGSQDLFESRSHATENRMITSSLGRQQQVGSSMGAQQRMVRESTDFFEQSKMITKSSSGGKSKTYG